MSEPEQEDAGGKANLVLLLRRLWPHVDDPEAWQDIVWRKFGKKIVHGEDLRHYRVPASNPARGRPRHKTGFAALVGDSYRVAEEVADHSFQKGAR